MPTPLATLDLYRIGNADYSAGRSRSANTWHLVRKQYGDDSATFNYARFTGTTAQADYLAARQNPALAQWANEPYSEYDYTLLLLPLSTPLPASTASTGPVTPVAAGSGTVDMSPVVSAVNSMSSKLPGRNADGSLTIRTQDNGQPLLVMIAPGTTPPRLATDAATETTLGKVLEQLLGTLRVTFDGGVEISNFPTAFWQDVQPVSLAAVPLAGNAATATLQMVGNSSLQDIATKLGAGIAVTVSGTQQVTGTVGISGTVPVSLNFPTTQAVSGPLTDTQLRAAPVPVSFSFPAVQAVSGPATDAQLRATPLPVSVAGVATAALQGTGNNLLTTIATNTAGLATAAAQATQQTALDAIKANTTGGATATLQGTANTALAAIQTSAAAGSTAALQTDLNAKVATAAKQDTGNASLASLDAKVPAQVGGRLPVDVGTLNVNSSIAPKTTGGLASRLVITNAGTTLAPSLTPTVVKNAAGQVYAIDAFNEAGSKRYLNLYNKATAPAASDTPTQVFVLFPGAGVSINYGDLGSTYPAGIAFTISTNNGALASLTNLLTGLTTANECTVNISYA